MSDIIIIFVKVLKSLMTFTRSAPSLLLEILVSGEEIVKAQIVTNTGSFAEDRKYCNDIQDSSSCFKPTDVDKTYSPSKIYARQVNHSEVMTVAFGRRTDHNFFSAGLPPKIR